MTLEDLRLKNTLFLFFTGSRKKEYSQEKKIIYNHQKTNNVGELSPDCCHVWKFVSSHHQPSLFSSLQNPIKVAEFFAQTKILRYFC